MFVLALIPLSLILRKAEATYEFSGSKEKINHLLFMDDLKLYSRNEKGVWYREARYVSDREREDCEISWYRVSR